MDGNLREKKFKALRQTAGAGQKGTGWTEGIRSASLLHQRLHCVQMSGCPHAGSNHSHSTTSPITTHYYVSQPQTPASRRHMLPRWWSLGHHTVMEVSPVSAHEHCLPYFLVGFLRRQQWLKQPLARARADCHWSVALKDRLRLEAWGCGAEAAPAVRV